MDKNVLKRKEKQEDISIKKQCLNSKETAEYLGLCETNILKYLRSGEIPSIRMGRRYLIPKEALDKWLNEQVHDSKTSHN